MSESTTAREAVTAPDVPKTSWAGYAACAWGLIFAGISFYWGSGGRRGLDTIGGSIEKLALESDPSIYLAVWVTGLLKAVGAALALALVRPWGLRLPRRPVLVLGWIATVLTLGYGGLLVAGDALAATGAVKPSAPIAWKPLLWHLWVWDMSFLIWGLLFALALRRFVRASRV